jgi:hypothetical protein
MIAVIYFLIFSNEFTDYLIDLIAKLCHQIFNNYNEPGKMAIKFCSVKVGDAYNTSHICNNFGLVVLMNNIRESNKSFRAI